MRHVAVQRGRGIAAGFQALGQQGGGRLGAHEHQQRVERLHFQYPGQRVQLVKIVDGPVALVNGGGGSRSRPDRNFLRVAQVAAGDPLHFGWHRGGEQGHLARFGSLLENPLDVIDETHAQHFVGFVQHQRLQAIQPECALAHVVHDSAGRADHRLHATLQLADLSRVVLSAVNGQHVETLDAAGVALKRLGHLDGQLPRGRQHHDLHTGLIRPEPGQQGQRECRGLASAGGGVAQQVEPVQQVGNRLRLDRCRAFVTDLIECGQQGVGQTKFAEGRNGRAGIGHQGLLPSGSAVLAPAAQYKGSRP